MKKILFIILGVCLGIVPEICYTANKFDMLPDFLTSAVYAASVTTVETGTTVITQHAGYESGFASMLVSLIFVILLVYAIGILYTKLNKFGLKVMKGQIGRSSVNQVFVLSTTLLGTNKSLHVVELDGKRMLIGASANSIHLIKDLGSCSENEIVESEFSNVEIPSMKTPRIEIPNMERARFTNVGSKAKKEKKKSGYISNPIGDENLDVAEGYERKPEGIMDKLFNTVHADNKYKESNEQHKVNPDEFALYKKYL